jgi:hypothetical protein
VKTAFHKNMKKSPISKLFSFIASVDPLPRMWRRWKMCILEFFLEVHGCLKGPKLEIFGTGFIL